MPSLGWENRERKAEGIKKCNTCGEVKQLAEFNTRNIAKGWYKSLCRACESARFKRYYVANAEEMRERSRDYYANWKGTRFEQVLKALGRKCACCGETDPTFLTVDHINNDGWKEKVGTERRARSGRALWTRIRKEGYPKSRYRILCFNCNCGRNRRADKRCPHELRSKEMASGFLKSPFKDAYEDGKSVGSSDVTGAHVVKGDLDINGSKLVIGFPIGDEEQALFECIDGLTGQK